MSATDEIRGGPHLGDAAPHVQLVDHDGARRELSELWRNHPLVLLFVRHFGCPFCREQLSDIRDQYAQFREAGGDVAVVAMGSPAETAAFRTRLKLPFIVLADAERKAYRAFGVERGGMGQIAGPAVWLSGAKALLRGGVGIPRGDVRQMSAAFVIDSAGIVRLAHRSANSADTPTNDQLLAALRSLAE